MNEAWRNIDADAHHAKVEAIETAIAALEGLQGALDNIEEQGRSNAVGMLTRARDREEAAAKLAAVA